MSINFQNASTLSFSQRNGIFSEDGDTFKREIDISISGSLLDLVNSNGVKKNIQGAEAFLNSALEDNQEVIINGEVFGDGVVEGFSVSGEFIRDAQYEISLKIYSGVKLSDLQFSGAGNDLNFNSGQTDITEEDLSFLQDFNEDVVLEESSDGILISHSISSTFSEKKNMINDSTVDWLNSQPQENKVKNLRNRGKRSIKVSSGTSQAKSTRSVSGLAIAEEYVFSIEYLGYDSPTSSKLNKIAIKSPNLKEKTFTKPGKYEIVFTPASSSISIEIYSPAQEDSFYKNAKLLKKRDTPLALSRSLAGIFLGSSPIYGVIEKEKKGVASNLGAWKKDSEVEGYEELSFKYSKKINLKLLKDFTYNKDPYITPTPNQKDFTFSRSASINLIETGVFNISESLKVKMLEGATSQEIDKILSDLSIGAMHRCEEALKPYYYGENFGCPTPTKTHEPMKSFLRPGSKEITKDLLSGEASLIINFSTDPNIESIDYSHNKSISIEKSNNNYIITQSGSVIGSGGSVKDRSAKAKAAFINYVEPTIESNILSHRSNLLKLDPLAKQAFFQKLKGLTFSNEGGLVQYQYVYTNDTSSDEVDKGIIKEYKIEKTEQEAVLKFNEFVIGCKNIAQLMNKLNNQKNKSITISSLGFEGKSISQIYNESIRILDSENFFNVYNDDYILSKKMSFSRSQNSMSITVDGVNLSECRSTQPTPTPDGKFGSSYDFSNAVYPTPTIVPIFQNPGYTPFPRTPTPYSREEPIYPTPTPTPT